MQKTVYPSIKDREPKWFVVDAENKVLGRLATEIARVLRGKHKPSFSPSVDMGDHVIVLNADKIALTGRKPESKVYRRHTGYLGGLKEVSLKEMLANHPDRIITKAVWGMLPKNRLGRAQIKKLRVYAGTEHPHEAQQPQPLEV